jgi:type IV secretory pathway VirB4 component
MGQTYPLPTAGVAAQAPQPPVPSPQPQYQQAQPVPPAPPQSPYTQTPYQAAPPPQVAQPVAAGPVVASAQPAAPRLAPKTNPNSTQNALQIAEIRDGIVIMNDGSFRSVVMVKSINFDLMSPQEQEAVEYAYQGFLNSLYFPVQIFIRSQKVDLQPYIEKLDKIRTEHENMLLALLMDDYIGYIDQLAQQTNIMDKKFYLVIPFFPVVAGQKALANAIEQGSQNKNFFSGLTQLFNTREDHVVINEGDLEKAKAELRNRVQSVLGGLQQSGIQLYYDTYNPDTATRQQLKNFNDLSADIVTKGQGTAPQAHLQRELQ